MSRLDELPLSTSAYLADTQHLSLPQHGAYLLILMTMWRAGGWISDDDKKLANICKLSVPKWLKIAPDIRALLLPRDGRLSQKRLLSEIETVLKTVTQNRLNGASGGRAKALKSKDPNLATAKVSLGGSLGVRQNGNDSALTVLKEDSVSRVKKKVRAEFAKGERLPSDWRPSEDHYSQGEMLGITRTQVDSYADKMRNWADANSHRAVARKSNWDAAFRNWLADKGGKNGGGHATNRNGDQQLGFSAIAHRVGGGAFPEVERSPSPDFQPHHRR